MPYLTKSREEELSSMIEKRVGTRALRLERLYIEEQSLKQMAYYSGKQHFYQDHGSFFDSTEEEDDDEWEVTYTANHMRNTILRAVAKVIGINLEFKAAPQSGSIRHRAVAKTSEKVFDHLRDITDFNRHEFILWQWAAICGSSFGRVMWDQMEGEPDRFYFADKDGRALIPPQMLTPPQKRHLELNGQFRDLYRGEVKFSVESLFSVYHDWSSRDAGVAGCQWMASKHYVDRERIADAFNLDVDDIRSDEGAYGLTNYEEAIAFMSSGATASPFNWLTPDDKRGERALLIDLWQRPSRAHPHGRRVVQAGGRIVYDGINPNIGDSTRMLHLPWVKADWVHHPGRFWGSSLAEDLTSPQNQLNQSRQYLLSFMRVFGSPATYIDPDAELDPDKMVNRAGAIYRAKLPNQYVKHGPTPQLPPEVATAGAVVQGDLDMIGSQSNIDARKLPGQMRSGTALRTMEQERSIALNLTALERVSVVRDVGRMFITLAQLNYKEKRTMQYLGENRQFVVEDFVAADLTNDLRIVATPTLMDTVAGQRADLYEMIDVGVLNPRENPKHAMLALKALHFDTTEEAFSDLLAAEANQEREIREMIAQSLLYGETPYPVMEWEDHETEARVCQRFMYTEEFRRLPNMTKSVITTHWKLHTLEAKKQQQAALAMMEQLKGTPGGTGTASQPRTARAG